MIGPLCLSFDTLYTNLKHANLCTSTLLKSQLCSQAGEMFSERCFMSEGGRDMTKYMRNLVNYQNTLLYLFCGHHQISLKAL